MSLENAPAAFDRIVFAVIRRIVSKADVDLMLFNEIDHSGQELGTSSAILGAIVLKQNQCVDVRKSGLVFVPPVVEHIHDAVACNFGCADRDG